MRQKKSKTTVNNEDTNTFTLSLSIGDIPVRQKSSRFSLPRQQSAITSANDSIAEHSQNEQSNAVFNIGYAKLAAEIIR